MNKNQANDKIKRSAQQAIISRLIKKQCYDEIKQIINTDMTINRKKRTMLYHQSYLTGKKSAGSPVLLDFASEIIYD